MTWRCFAATSRSSASRRASTSSRWRPDTYVGACDLLLSVQGERPYVEVAHAGELTLERLASERPVPGEERYLRFVPRPMDRLSLARWNRRADRPAFRAPGRLARVGLFARLVDAGFTGSLLVRGSVPGGTAAAAAQRYAAIRQHDQRVVYHGRVVRADGWIVLHYLFVYCHERLAVVVLRRERPRGRPRAGLRRPRGQRQRRARSRAGSAVRRMTTPATTCGAAGTIRPCRSPTATR